MQTKILERKKDKERKKERAELILTHTIYLIQFVLDDIERNRIISF